VDTVNSFTACGPEEPGRQSPSADPGVRRMDSVIEPPGDSVADGVWFPVCFIVGVH